MDKIQMMKKLLEEQEKKRRKDNRYIVHTTQTFVKIYDIYDRKSSVTTSIQKWCPEIVQIGQIFYVAGGRWSQETYRVTFSAESSTNLIVNQMNDMNYLRCAFGMTHINGKYLFAIGGMDLSKEYTKVCERFDIERNKWTKVQSLKQGQYVPLVSTFNNRLIYSFASIYNLDLEVYDACDPELGWEKIKPKFGSLCKNEVRWASQSTQVSNKFILFGQQLKFLGKAVLGGLMYDSYTQNLKVMKPGGNTKQPLDKFVGRFVTVRSPIAGTVLYNFVTRTWGYVNLQQQQQFAETLKSFISRSYQCSIRV
eukprot:TRINITY_DN52095_c0_g1_i1.p1 TRINITY_DN52095_c0_g1~~TRINITY_DN52095_c0_g1_i1.p1  ORF type:complete len:309 (-),score=7.53 TRINITY_DN52095_c0_g1_i1:52-978(-)